ncbi:M48 family metallopeptidase [Methylotenera sp. L2L1]|uniref:M48 family metallopeptidase n=1 Tax=Methylotenera sp. L2L1 TaxID=1502770 RepID=UPI00068E590D|nr:M48 family metallopeptidase [Methylotenera sp. L2L1]
MQFDADYFDGISPRAQRVLVSITDNAFTFNVTMASSDSASPTSHIFFIKDCHIQAKLGRGRRLIDLPDSSRLETDFQDIEQHLPRKSAHLFWRTIHYAESHLLVIIIALIGIVLSSLLLLKYGVPVAAKFAALATPPSIEKDLGKQTLAALDHQLGYFTPSELSDAKKAAIESALKDLCLKTGDCPDYQLNFRKSPTIGANAFALPGGYLIMTDELVALAKDNNEIIAVLAHELGHVKGRHALRQTLQGTISGIIVIAITGDVSSIAAGLPALMLNMSYSRDLEVDADHYALTSLRAACIPTQSFASLLLKLEKSHGGTTAPEMISSHPNTKERVMPFLSKQHQCEHPHS